MGAIKNNLKQQFNQIYSNVDPNVTAAQKADQMATAIENAILQGLKVKIPTGKVVVQAQNAVKNPSEINCTLDS